MRSYGQVAYEAYSEHSGGKSLISGAELPSWDLLSSEIRAAWEASAKAVERALVEHALYGSPLTTVTQGNTPTGGPLRRQDARNHSGDTFRSSLRF